jgi:hypothetical protein
MTRLLHYLHEMTLGGGTVHCLQLTRDMTALGVPTAVATYQDGEMRERYQSAGVPVFLMKGPEELEAAARSFGANVLHGHTCGGGSDALGIARRLKVVGGETIHSMVARSGPMAGDFEVVEVEKLAAMRPGATRIPWAFPEARFTVDVAPAATRTILGIPPDAPVIGRNGRLDGSKAPDVFIQVLAAMPPHVWGLMVGDGPMAADLKTFAKMLGVADRLVMPGTRHDPGNLFAVMDVVVYPTHDESVCAGIVEPLICRKPVVCTPVGAMDETIIHGETGLCATDVPGLARYALWLLQEPQEAARLGRQGYQHLARKGWLDPVGEAKAHRTLYEACLESRGF